MHTKQCTTIQPHNRAPVWKSLDPDTSAGSSTGRPMSNRNNTTVPATQRREQQASRTRGQDQPDEKDRAQEHDKHYKRDLGIRDVSNKGLTGIQRQGDQRTDATQPSPTTIIAQDDEARRRESNEDCRQATAGNTHRTTDKPLQYATAIDDQEQVTATTTCNTAPRPSGFSARIPSNTTDTSDFDASDFDEITTGQENEAIRKEESNSQQPYIQARTTVHNGNLDESQSASTRLAEQDHSQAQHWQTIFRAHRHSHNFNASNGRVSHANHTIHKHEQTP